MPNLHIESIFYLLALVLLIIVPQLNNATRITGTYRTDEFFRFLNKFGFQKTDKHSEKDSYSYIFGNITSNDDLQNPFATLVVLDKNYFKEFYENRTFKDRNVACQAMFKNIERLEHDPICNEPAIGNYLRKVPCQHGGLCIDEDLQNVVPGSQFTYRISDEIQPRLVIV